MLSTKRRILFSQIKLIIKSVHRFTSKTQELRQFADTVINEPQLTYKEGSKERQELQAAISALSNQVTDIPIVIGDEEIRTKNGEYQTMPHNHRTKIAKYYIPDEAIVRKAIAVTSDAQADWSRVEPERRIEIWRRAADLMSTKYRQCLNAATMLGQGKTVYQAEIDSACELIDFTRMNAAFYSDLLEYSPNSPNPTQECNYYVLRPLEGFTAAISPFNFTAIGGNLAFTPALLGNVVLWKPSLTAILSNYLIFKIMREAGVPPGVVNFLPCYGLCFGKSITTSPDLTCINFTGSVQTFQWLQKHVCKNFDIYTNIPRLIGELGGKNFHFVHPSADVDTVVSCTIRSAFEYSGQKCSACSRLYLPESLKTLIIDKLIAETEKLKIGDPTEFDTFTGAVIDESSYDRIKDRIRYAKRCRSMKILKSHMDNSKGWFIHPTLILVEDPKDKIMKEEIFGPVLCIYVYKECELFSVIDDLCNSTKYALTGAIFANCENFLQYVPHLFQWAAGNLYINDKSTGAVVGQQPFGGARLSGTNDKAGSSHYLLRFISPQCIKRKFIENIKTN